MLWIFKQKSTENIFFESAKTTANSTDYFTVTKSSEPENKVQVTARTQATAETASCSKGIGKEVHQKQQRKQQQQACQQH